MNDPITIHKFGGSCLRDSSDLDRIAEVVGHWDGQSIVVVSALWGTTDRLMRASKEPRYASRLVNDLSSQHLRFAPGLLESELGPKFTKVLKGIEQSLVELARRPAHGVAINRLLAAGERLSALVVAHRLKQYGIAAHPVGAEDIGLRLDGVNRAPTVDLAASMGLLDRKALHDTPVITGWFGEGKDGQLALLSRGGSDHTATSIARLVDANRVILWKDVRGVLPLNPRWGIETEPIAYLGYGEAMELSRLDTPILHPATVEPLMDTGIPLEIRHLHGSMDKSAATVVGPNVYEKNHLWTLEFHWKSVISTGPWTNPQRLWLVRMCMKRTSSKPLGAFQASSQSTAKQNHSNSKAVNWVKCLFALLRLKFHVGTLTHNLVNCVGLSLSMIRFMPNG